MRTYRALLAAILAAFVLGAADPLPAQTTTGSIRGYVTAEGGAVIVGADVRARNTATGVERMATTNTRGFYSLSGLVPGQYALAVRHIGHRPMGQTVQVQIGQDLTLNFSLATSAVQLEELTVSAAPAVETRSTEVATNVTPAQVEALPKSDRNFLALAVRSIPIGTGYAVWTGIGAVGVAMLGMILFDEPRTLLRIISILLIVAGIAGLKLVTA